MSKSNLEEYVQLIVETVLAENPGGGMRLRDIVLQPAKDVAQTASYAGERISGAAQTLVKGLAYIIPTILIPGLEFNYALFKKDEDAKMAEIKKKYGEVLARNWEAMKDPDVFGFMLLAYPQAMLGYAALKRSPLAFLHLLEVATGGMDSVRSLRQSLEQTSAYTPRTTQYSDPMGGGQGGMGGMGGDMYGDYGGMGMTGESVQRLSEAQPVAPQAPAQPQQAQPQAQPAPQQNPQMLQQIWALVQQPQVQQALAKSPMFREMQAASVDVMVAPLQRFMQVQNLDQMKGFIGQAAVEKAKAEFNKNKQLASADPQTKAQILAQVVAQTKKAYKETYIQKLMAAATKAPQARQAIDTAVTRIRAIK